MLSGLTNFAQGYSYYGSPTSHDSGLSGFAIVFGLIGLAVGIISLVSMWQIFKKAGQPGWAAIVPIYNYLILLKIVGRPWWWILVMFVGFVPFVGWIAGTVVSIIVLNDLAKSFGKGPEMTVALVFLVGFPILAFSDAKYHGPAALNTPGGMTGPAPTHGGTPPKA